MFKEAETTRVCGTVVIGLIRSDREVIVGHLALPVPPSLPPHPLSQRRRQLATSFNSSLTFGPRLSEESQHARSFASLRRQTHDCPHRIAQLMLRQRSRLSNVGLGEKRIEKVKQGQKILPRSRVRYACLRLSTISCLSSVVSELEYRSISQD